MNHYHDKHFAKLRWACRRGMLELDLLLLPFLENKFDALSEQDKVLFERFLASNDQDLYDWLIKRIPPEDAEFPQIIENILTLAKHDAV